MQSLSCSSIPRAGNSLVVALGILTAIAAMVILASESAVHAHISTTQVRGGIEAIGAVEFVLARREQQVVELANLGDPVAFAHWKEHFGTENYGVDYVGNCEVRWKVEPCYTAPRNDPDNPTQIEFIANPNPDPTWAPEVGSKQIVNDNTYLFRIAAEARYTPSSPEQVLARAQGVRYGVINKEPLFRYVIFYAQSGNKGDLEITHEDKVEIQGNVHTNGALYMGSGSLTNDYAAVSGPSAQTIIGPTAWRDLNLNGEKDSGETNLPVRVTAVDGIFRLSKQTMYGALNGFPMKSEPRDWSASSAYDADPTHRYPRDSEIGITAEELAEIPKLAGRKVNVINPYRVKDESGFVTMGQGFKHLNPGLSITSAQLFNWDPNNMGIPLLGANQDLRQRNDSRDGWYVDKGSSAWKQYSGGPTAFDPNRPQGFAGYLRTNETGARVKKLPRELSGVDDAPLRPLERQQIVYTDADHNPATDQHELAAPIFLVKHPDANKSPSQSAADYGRIVEVPGKYLGLALGDGCLTRNPDGSGWQVKKITATGLGTPLQTPKMGLAILERPVPDAAIWPGRATINIVSSSSPDYLPYAYGKHWRPFPRPLFPIDVSENVTPGSRAQAWRGIGFDSPLTDADTFPVNRNGTLRRYSYSAGGTLTVTAACREGAPLYQDLPELGGLTRSPKWFNDNWRFFHLKRPQWGGIAQPGVKVSYFKDSSPKNESAPEALASSALIMATWGGTTDPANYNGRALSGAPDLAGSTLTSAQVAMPPLNSIAAAVGSDASKRCRFSLRFEGFIVPRYSEVYTFTARGDDGVRLWFDGDLATFPGSWSSQPLTRFPYTTNGPLVANTPYHFVLDYYQSTGGNMVGLEWTSASQSTQDIPSGTTVAPARGLYLPEVFTGFDASNFTYVQCKIDPAKLSGPAEQKIGLMLRDGHAGLSPLLSGRDSYLALLFNPQRGFFTQRRLAPAIPAVSEHVSWFVGSGGRFRANGIVHNVDSEGMAPAVLPNNGTVNQGGSPIVYSDWNRPSTLTKESIVDHDPVLTFAPYDATKRPFIESEAVPVTINVQLCDLGDGNPFVAKFGYKGATDTARKVWIPRVDAFYQRQRDVVVVMNSLAVLPNFVGARSLKVFSYNATATTSDLEFSPVDVSRRDDKQLNLIYTIASSMAQGLGTPATSELKVKENWVFAATPQQIIKMNSKNWNGRNDWMLPDQPVSLFDLANNRVYPVDPPIDWATCATPVPLIPPTLTQWDDAFPRSFALNLNKDAPYVVGDVNSYVSSYGQWSDALVEQYRPWSSSWDQPGQFFIPPLTHSYRPDQWDDSPFPTSGGQNTKSLLGLPRWVDDQPNPGGELPPLGPNLFLRIEQVAPHLYNFRYYSGTKSEDALTTSDFRTLRDSAGAALTANLSGWSSNLLVGPCVQSGSATAATNVVFENLSIKVADDRSDVNHDGIVDGRDWDATGLGSGSPTARYLASQYQVFFGIYDITEDFFSYLSSQPSAACASEEWFYSPREFWSQSRTWEDGTEKDATDAARITYAGHSVTTNRQLLGKTTVLTLNLGKDKADLDNATAGIQAEGIQGYLCSRSLSEAVTKPMSSGAVPGIVADGNLADLFNGLLYASRTNRYPWNPNRSATYDSGANPWSSDPFVTLPNSFSANNPDMVSLSAASMPAANMFWQGVHKLQPYPLAVAPAFRPDDFHHGVRIRNASDLYWGYKLNKFGESKTSIVCPNAVYVQGNVNTVKHLVTVRGVAASINKHTPLAIFGDSINLESEKFNPLNYQNAGISVTPAGVVSGNGILANPAQMEAEDTAYVACFLTHNLPTSRERVREGQSAAFIDTMLFNEDWNPSSGRKTMAFKGSLVVMDSRRYTRAFLLDANKQYGRTVFGTTVADELYGNLRTQWESLLGARQWTQSAPSVYRSPIRTYTFNDDLLTAEGTPPFTPFGVTSGGVGGWVRIVE